jgi:hypothetical protein
MMSAFAGISAHITARILLHVQEENTADEIRAAFRKKATTTHPDRGGDTDAMRDLIAARDILLRPENHRQHPPRRVLQANAALEMEAFSRRAKIPLVECYLALARIKKWGLSLDHPRAAKIARAEANRSSFAERPRGVITPPRDGAAAVADSDAETDGAQRLDTFMRVDESQIAPAFREKQAKKGKKWSMTLINPASPATPVEKLADKEEAAARVAKGLPADPAEAIFIERESRKKRVLALRAALKPRDREVLDLYLIEGLKVKQIAERIGKTDKAVYASIARIGAPLRDARERKEWVDEHCSIEKLASGVASAPVVLSKTGQTGWDLEGMEVQS